MTTEKLNSLRDELEAEMNGSAWDFANDHDIADSYYLSDAFMEWADSNTSIYYSDQREYYYFHSEECDFALTMLYDGATLGDMIRKQGLDSIICLAGACGEYEAIYGELSENEEEIKKLLVINHLLELEEEEIAPLNDSQLNELLEEAGARNINRINDLLDLVNEYLETEEETEED